jgi:hypothetical protein
MQTHERLQLQLQKKLDILNYQNDLYDTFFEAIRLKNFIQNTEVLHAILMEIPIMSDLPTKVLDSIVSGTEVLRGDREASSYDEDVLVAWCVVQQLGGKITDTNIVRNVVKGTTYNTGRSEDECKGSMLALKRWCQIIVEYLLDKFSNNHAVLFSLIRYKRRLEWFRTLPNSVGKQLDEFEKGNPGKQLEPFFFMPHLYKFLFNEGVNFYIEAQQNVSREGYVDFIAWQPKQRDGYIPLIGEGKYVSDQKHTPAEIKKNCSKWFKQINDYLNSFNISVGYLVIFWRNVDLKIRNNLQSIDSLGVNFIEHNGRRIFIILIDIADNPPASEQKYGFVDIDKNDWVGT